MRDDSKYKMSSALGLITGRDNKITCMSTVEPNYIQTSSREDLRCAFLGAGQSIGWDLGIIVDKNSHLWIFREALPRPKTGDSKRNQKHSFDNPMHGLHLQTGPSIGSATTYLNALRITGGSYLGDEINLLASDT